LPTVAIANTPKAPNTLDAGQSITFNAIVSGGSPPYTYNFYVYNSITNAIVNDILSISTNGFVFVTNSNLVGNTLVANVFVTDNAGYTINSALTGIFTVNALPTVAIANTPKAPNTLDAGQSITCNATVSEASHPYTYNFYVYNRIT